MSAISPAAPGPRDINLPFIGKAGGRGLLATPALVLDLDLFERNLQIMAEHCKAKGLGLRPHAKTHKSAQIARLQIDAGALGICAAKLGEAEALGQAGIQSIHLTSPVVTDPGIGRVMALNAKIADLMITVEDMTTAAKLGAAAKSAGKPLNVIIDLDVGLHRTGIPWGPQALALTVAVASSEGLIYRGIQGYAGHVMHIEDFAERSGASSKCMDVLKQARDVLSAKGLEPQIITGGGFAWINCGDHDVAKGLVRLAVLNPILEFMVVQIAAQRIEVLGRNNGSNGEITSVRLFDFDSGGVDRN